MDKKEIISPEEPVSETSETCKFCSRGQNVAKLIKCPRCHIKVHQQCLLINEPMLLHKINSVTWLCTNCRKQYCSKCLKDESQAEIAYHCSSCDIGFHYYCYEPYEIKPLYKIEEAGYICIPCIDLATQIHPEERDDDEDNDEPEPSTSGTVIVLSDRDDSDSYDSLYD